MKKRSIYCGGKRKSPPVNYPHRVTFRLADQHKIELENFALNEGVTRSVLVRHLVIRFLEDQRKLLPPKPGVKP